MDSSFDSIRHILRDVNGGWLIRSLHANGASFFFIALYAHIGRGIYYGSYLFIGVWVAGLLLLLLVMSASFLGYVLPWGQMSFWGATVITNLFSAFPYVGSSFVSWLWGGFTVDAPTLTRFFTLHYLIPFLVTATTCVHIYLLHSTGRNNPLGVPRLVDAVPFHWYYTSKDFYGFAVFYRAMLYLSFFEPTLLMEAENFIPANPIVTPPHIVPEWYFLFAYAILRSVPSKIGGVVIMFSAICSLLLLPILHFSSMKGLTYYGPVKALFWAFVACFFLLTVAGSWVVESPFIIVSRCLSTAYFLFFPFLRLSRWVWDHILS